MSSAPLVSIITPTFNSATFLPETLQCIAEQTYPHVEHIVVDGGSSDDTIDILKKQGHVSWKSESDNGMYDGINKGLRMAKGSILAYLNSDDLYFLDSIERAVRAFEEHPDVGLIYSDCRYIDENGEELFIRKYPRFNWTLYAVLTGSTIAQQTCFWRRSVIEKVGVFDARFTQAGDFEFLIRAGRECRFMKLGGPPLAQFRFHPQMQSLNQLERVREEVSQINAMYGFSPGMRTTLLRLIGILRYKITNLHRIKDKSINLVTGRKVRYRA